MKPKSQSIENAYSESSIMDSKPVSLEEKKESPYDQFLGATQRRADSHKTADEACEQKTAIVSFFPSKRHICMSYL